MSSVITVNTQTLRGTGTGRHTISNNFYNKKDDSASIFSNKSDESHLQTLRRNADHYELQPKRDK